MRNASSVLLLIVVASVGCKSDGDKKDPKSGSGAPVSSASRATTPADTKPASRELPFNPHARSALGDWYGAVVKVRYEGKPPSNPMPALSVWTWTGADGTEGEKLVIAFDMKPRYDGIDVGTSTRSRKEAPKGEDFIGGYKPEEITDWKVEDEKKTVGDKVFDCKKITATTTGEQAEQITVWLCPDVPMTGIVALTRRTDLGGGNVQILEHEVAGFKTGEPQAQWGKAPEELSALADGK